MKKKAMLYKRRRTNNVDCFLCSHNCQIPPTGFGRCGVRQNINGDLFTLTYGDVVAANIDPIEKKPLYHFLPGSLAFSIAMIGCNFKCDFCQNWQISQRNMQDAPDSSHRSVTPESIVQQAKADKCASISYTYTEPTIFFEFAYDTAKLAKKAGIKNSFVTNGYMTKAAIEKILPYLDAANIDLKSFRDEFYQKRCNARLKPVLESIENMKKMGIWVEVTTLLIPGENDSTEELKDIASFIAHIDKNMPWHISRYHPDYLYDKSLATPIDILRKAYKIGQAAGLNFIYFGNVLEGADTFCPQCHKGIINRSYFEIKKLIIENSLCPYCQTKINGVWS